MFSWSLLKCVLYFTLLTPGRRIILCHLTYTQIINMFLLFWKIELYNRAHKTLQLDPILSPLNTNHPLYTHTHTQFTKLRHKKLLSKNYLLLLISPEQNSVRISYFNYACHMSSLSQSSWFNYPSNIKTVRRSSTCDSLYSSNTHTVRIQLIERH